MKSSRLLMMVAVCGLFLPVQAQPEQVAPDSQLPQTFERNVAQKLTARFLLSLPEGYGRDPTQKWPLILFLHSADARGENTELLKREGLPALIRAGKMLPFIVVSPQCPANEWWDSRWSVETLNALLDTVQEKYAVDRTRVYLTGWSMGGAGTWRLASAYPERFAAIAPVSGRAQLVYVPRLRTLPVWAFHGEDDTVVPVSESKKMVTALQDTGATAQLTLLKGVGHDAWPAAYSSGELFDWLLRHRREP